MDYTDFSTDFSKADDIFLQDDNVAAADNGCLEFDGTIERDGNELILLAEGDYFFTVVETKRGRFPGSEKLPACNKVTLSLRVDSSEGTAYVKTDLILHKKLEWKLSSFFRSIGMKKHGERLVMDWNGAVGRRGLAHFAPREYPGSDGQTHKTNDCKSFLDRPARAAQEPVQGAKTPVQVPNGTQPTQTQMVQPTGMTAQGQLKATSNYPKNVEVTPSAPEGWTPFPEADDDELPFI